MRLRDVFAVLRVASGAGDERIPLAVVHAEITGFNQFGVARMHEVDPRGFWARHDPSTVERLQRLLGTQWSSLGQACQVVYRAYKNQSDSRTNYMTRFECFVKGEIKRAQLGTHEEVSLSRGEQIASRFSPDLATVEAASLVGDSQPEEHQGCWCDLGEVRPVVPQDMPEEAASRALEQMHRKVRAGRPAARHRRRSTAQCCPPRAGPVHTDGAPARLAQTL
jgi:hypothetical protein